MLERKFLIPFAILGGFSFYFFLTALFIGVVIEATYTQGYSYGGPILSDILAVGFGNSFWICFTAGVAGAIKTWWAVDTK